MNWMCDNQLSPSICSGKFDVVQILPHITTRIPSSSSGDEGGNAGGGSKNAEEEGEGREEEEAGDSKGMWGS